MRYLLSLWLALFAFTAHAASRCNESAVNSSAYLVAANGVRQLPEFRAWVKSHSFPAALGAVVDREAIVNGVCYWSVSVYADRTERLEMWNVFYVRRPNNVSLVQDPTSGEPISITAWREKMRGSRAKK